MFALYINKKSKILVRSSPGNVRVDWLQLLIFWPFCFRLHNFRLYKSHEVLQNTITYWILCEFTSLEGNLVLEYWNNMRRRLTIALNMLITANYFVGLKWWHQKAVTGKSLVMKIKISVLDLSLFFWSSSFWWGIYCLQLLTFSFHCFSGILFLSLCQLKQKILISSTPAH